MTAYQGFNATIVAVTPAFPGDSVYAVKILHATNSTSGKPVSALALQRLSAVRAPGSPFGWQLANALPRVTRDWRRRDVGRITFWYAPGQKESFSKATETAQFVESVAKLFAVTPPAHIDAYVTASTDEAWRAVGLDFFPDGSGPDTGFGGRSIPPAGIVLIGDPRVGEDYLHEFVHVVLSPTLHPGNALFNVVAASQRPKLRTAVGVYEFHRLDPSLMAGAEPFGTTGAFDVATSAKALFDTLYVSVRRGRRFAALPELEFPRDFRVREMETWIRQIAYAPLREAVHERWNVLYRNRMAGVHRGDD